MKSKAVRNHEKGMDNQRKSRDWMIDNPDIYGVLSTSRIEIVRSGMGSKDFFSVVYGIAKKLRTERTAKIDPEGSDKKVHVKTGFVDVELKAGFDLISIPFPVENMIQDIFLVQVKSNSLPSNDYIDSLISIPVPIYVKKELHIWYDKNKIPKIIRL